MKKHLEDLTGDAVLASATGWLRERVDWEPVLEFAAHKTVPIHRWSFLYLLGGAALFLLVIQVATGCLLMLYYQPSRTPPTRASSKS